MEMIKWEDNEPVVLDADGIIKLADELLVDIGRARMLNEIAQRDIERWDEWMEKRNELHAESD